MTFIFYMQLLVQTRNPGIYYQYAIPLKTQVSQGTSPDVSYAYNHRNNLPKYLQDALGML